MGLDGVELLMAVEEEFKIAISYEEAAQCVTVGKLVDLVHSRLQQTREAPCASQHGFYVIRDQLVKVLGAAREQIKPETNLKDLLGRKDRKRRWRVLIQSIVKKDPMLPGLVRPAWMILVLLLLMAGVCFSLTFFTWVPFSFSLIVALIAGISVDLLMTPFKCELPSKITQVKDLIPFVTTLDSRILSKEEVFQKIRAITVEQLGVNESHVTLDAHFVDDLGV
jgi:acyl carrier protein